MPDPKDAPSEAPMDVAYREWLAAGSPSGFLEWLADDRARIVAHAEALEAAARRVIEADDEQVVWEVICRCQSADTDAGYPCSNHPDPENARHIPTYGMKEAGALESAMDALRATLTGPGERERCPTCGSDEPQLFLPVDGLSCRDPEKWHRKRIAARITAQPTPSPPTKDELLGPIHAFPEGAFQPVEDGRRFPLFEDEDDS